MEPNMKMLFDELAQLNRRFDEQDERWTRRFTGLEQSISERSTATVRRIDALEASYSSAVSDLSRRVADLESVPADPEPLAATARIATLEANYADRDDVRTSVQKLEKARAHDMFDELP